MAIIQIKRGTSAEWTTANPILALAELGLETDTNKMKAGDGASAWSQLPYLAGDGGGSGGAVTSVNGKTGAVTLDKADIELDNVNNTSDAAKPISNATQVALNTKASADDVNALTGRVTTNENNIAALQADSGDYAALNTRVTTNEGNIATNSSDIQTINGVLSGNAGLISGLDTRVTTNEGNIGTLQTTVAGHTSDIGNLQGDVAANTAGLNTTNGNVSTNTTNIATNASDISDLQTNKLANVVEDTSPQLGGDLDVQSSKLTSSTGEVTTDKNIEPDVTGTQDLGASDKRWQDVYVKDGVNYTDKRTGAASILGIRDGQLIVTNSTDEVTTAVDLGGTTPDPGHIRNLELDGTGRYAVGPSTLANTNGFITREFINTPGQFFVINDIDGGVFGPGDRQCFGLVRETIVDNSDLSGRTEGLFTGGNSGGWSTAPFWFYTGGFPYIWTNYSIAAQTPSGSGEGLTGTFSSQSSHRAWWAACSQLGLGKKYRVGIADGTNSCQSGTNYENRLIHQLYVHQEMVDDATILATLPAAVATYGAGYYTCYATVGNYENMGQFPADNTGYAASRQAGVDKGYRFRWSTFGNTTLNQLPYLQGVPSINDQIAAATGLSYYLVYEPTAADKAAANTTLATGTTSADNPFYVSKEVVLMQFQQPYGSFETAAANVFDVSHTAIGAVQASPLFTAYPVSTEAEIIESSLSVQGIEAIRAQVSQIVLQSVIGYYMIRQLDATDRATVRAAFADIIQAAETGQLQEVYDLTSALTADPLYPQELLDAILSQTGQYLKNFPVF